MPATIELSIETLLGVPSCGFELVLLCESERVGDSGNACKGGYTSKGAEKDIKFIDPSDSESLLSGMGIPDARRSESSYPVVSVKVEFWRLGGVLFLGGVLVLGGVGVGGAATVSGGEDGSAVSSARRRMAPRLGEAGASGDEVLLRNELSVDVDGEVGETARVELGGEREPMLGIAPVLTDRLIPPDAGMRDRGEGDVLGCDSGDDGRFENELRRLGDAARLIGGEVARTAWDVDVAWCRSVGGAVAIAFAFALLAAIAAAILVFFVFFGVVGGSTVSITSGFGQDFSSCFRATESRDARIASPRSRHTSSKTQKHTRALSRTAGFGSASARFTDFSRSSSPLEDSMALLARCPCTSRYFLM